MNNPVQWLEIATTDLERAKDFYASVFELQYHYLEMPESKMYMFGQSDGAGSSGCLMEGKGSNPSADGTIVYFSCEDVAVSAAKVEAAGGTVIIPKTDIGELEIYEPSIFIPNVMIANSELQALISPNIETELKDEDYILAWYFDEKGNQNETMLNESTATQTTNPILILNHSIPRAKMDKIGDYIKENQPSSPFAKSGDTYFESTRIKINNGYRYETGSNKSEFCLGGVLVRQGSPPANFLHNTSNNDYSLDITKVTKNQVSSSSAINVTSHHADNYTPYSDYRVFWNTFERDWNRSIQYLGNGTTFDEAWSFWGRARYVNDWYAWIPTALTQYTHFEWFGWETEIPFSSWKSEYNLVKVN